MSSQALPAHVKRLFKDLFEQVSLGIAVKDTEGRFLLANPTLCSMLGYTEKELRGMSCSQFANPEDSRDDWALFQQLRAGLIDHYSLEKRYVTKDGALLWGCLTVSLLKDKKGESTLVFAFVQNITERKRVEERLREYEEAIESSEDMIAVVDREYRYRSANRKFLKLLNVTKEQVVGRLVPEVLNKDVFEAVIKEKLDECFAGKIVNYEMRYMYPELGERDLVVSYFPIETAAGVDQVACILQDITDRKRAEEALRESEDKLRLLLDSTAEAIYGIDLEHRCTFCNPACLRALGYERIDDVLGKNMHELIHHTRPNGTVFPVGECRIHRVLRTGEEVCADDEVLWKADGTSFRAEYRSYPRRRGPEVVGAVVAFVDITERKLAQNALAQVSRKMIEAQEQERTRIARELHDDIGQRLALLDLETQELQEDPLISPAVQSRIGELQQQISEIADAMQSLSHDLHSAKLQYLGIAAAIKGFCQEFGEQQKVEIDFKTHDLPSPLSADISLSLFRVLQEALHNSLKHSRAQHFEVQLWGTSDEIHLTVRDSGVGFDRQAAKTGRGIGLISMEERLNLVKGTLSIDSQPTHGTTIHACVPLSSESDSKRAAE
jgi:PAS domain S-box-containing protein